MSDMSYFSSTSKRRRLRQIDDNIECLSQEVYTSNDIMYKTEFECSLMALKMKREKLNALSAFATSQALVAKMELLVAENDLRTEVEKLVNSRTRLVRNEDNSQVIPAPTKSVAVQTKESWFKKKKKTRTGSSSKSRVTSSENSVIIPNNQGNSASIVEMSLNKTPVNKSDSIASISSSIKTEFKMLVTKTPTQQSIKQSPNKKQKTEINVESKSICMHVSERTRSPTGEATRSDRTIPVNTASNHMDLNAIAVSFPNNSHGPIGVITSMTSAAYYVPLGHIMGVLITEPSSANAGPLLHINPANQANIPE